MATRDSILSTLAYHDIFSYPLTEQEAYNYSTSKSSVTAFKRSLQTLIVQNKVISKNGYLYLRGRGSTLKDRLKRKTASKQKLKRARYYAKLLRAVPTIRLVGISGALAMENANEGDDIDLVIITAKGTLWTTRLFTSLVLQPYRRKPGEPHTKNKACLNLFLDETSLKIGTCNLYIAHEIAQMRPIWQRGNTYSKFVKANSWVKTFLPNWQPDFQDSADLDKRLKTNDERKKRALVVSRLALVVEIFARKFQLRYMRSRITTEQIGDTQLFFHPANTQEWVLAKYRAKLKVLLK